MIDNGSLAEIAFLSKGSNSYELIRSIDWTKTSLGSTETWPQSLRAALSICVNSNFPIAIYWGKDLVLLYNEAWSPIPGSKHPWAFGKKAIEVWPDIWSDIEPHFAKAFNGLPGGSRDALLPMQRHGYTEECYFDFTFTPIYGASGNVEGIFNAVIETTYRVINERRAGVLQKLTDRLKGVDTPEQIVTRATQAMEAAKEDIPFYFFYTLDHEQPILRTYSRTHHGQFLREWPVDNLMRTGHIETIDNITEYLTHVPHGSWPERPTEALIVPLKQNDGKISGFIVGGISSRRKIDKDYKAFYESLATIIGSELNTLQSLTRERERAESLAQLDKAKTIFFNNISHEFRTPLTLMLSPLEKILGAGNLLPEQMDDLQTFFRNTLRLQKLVNTLLDFSRIEAGKMQAHFQPVNITQVTRDLASLFRAAIEAAGLRYVIDIHDVETPVLLDPDMWEKIVLNLISNAFKYTEHGAITVALRKEKDSIIFTVADTGVGIGNEHLNKIFERFYRINTQGGRSQEGTGIGLAMIKELIQLHGGEITVASKLAEGTSFVVKIPVGDNIAPEPQDLVLRDEARTRKAFVEEIGKWNASAISLHTIASGKNLPKALVADDNADMREYIARILQEDFEVHVVTNGEEAFSAATALMPHIIISDIMMPKLDGFGLLKKLRSNLITKNIPVIFLSARAGEEARVEGIRAGAEDYLIKPFSAKELLARAANQIAINKARLQTEREFFRIFLQIPAHIHVVKGPEHIVEFFHPLAKAYVGRDLTGMKIREAISEVEDKEYFEVLDRVYQKGETVSVSASKALLPGRDGKLQEFYFNITYLPWRDTNDEIQGVLQFSIDVTEQTKANLKLQESEQRFRTLANSIPQFVWIADSAGHVEYISDQWERYTGTSPEQGRKIFSDLIHAEEVDDVRARWKKSLETHAPWTAEFRLKNVNTLEYRWFYGNTVPLHDESGKVVKWIGSAADIHSQKTITFELEGLVAERTSELVKLNNMLVMKNEQLEKAQNFLQTVLDSSVELVTAFDQNLNLTFINKRLTSLTSRAPHDVIGKNLVEIDPGIVKTDSYQYLLRALAGEIVHIPSRRSAINPSLVFETFVIPLKHHNTVTGVVTMQRDITNIMRLTEDLKDSNDQLKRSNEDLQQFAHVTSHDLKEPVRKIKMYGNILSSDYAHYLPEKGKDYLQRIDKAASRIGAMIDGVLQYATVDVTEQKSEPVNLNEIIASIVEDLEIPVNELDANVEFDNLPTVKGFQTLLYQLFYNLVNNSLKFRKKDSAPVVKITSHISQDDSEYFTILVQDNGIGFEQAYAERIFESFTRLNSKDKYEGTGLGLALCRKIVLRHHGRITASSSVGAGSVFTISFPKSMLI